MAIQNKVQLCNYTYSNCVKFANTETSYMSMLNKITFFLFIAFLISNLDLMSQENTDWRLYKPTNSLVQDTLKPKPIAIYSTQQPTGNIDIIQDERIAKLNAKKKESPTKMDGYRVQIYFGDRNSAQEKRGTFIRNNPEIGAYISYLAPNFRLRVGDFRSRLESEKFKNEISKSFPGSYIVKDKIELPPLGKTTSDVN